MTKETAPVRYCDNYIIVSGGAKGESGIFGIGDMLPKGSIDQIRKQLKGHQNADQGLNATSPVSNDN